MKPELYDISEIKKQAVWLFYIAQNSKISLGNELIEEIGDIVEKLRNIENVQ